MEVMISKALIGLRINHDEFVSVNNVLREYNEIKEEIQNHENDMDYTIMYCAACKKNTSNKISRVSKTKQNKLMLTSNCVICGKNSQGY